MQRNKSVQIFATRMHSSSMRTARLLTVSRSPGEVCQTPWMHTPFTPWTEGMTHACENITNPGCDNEKF